MNKTLLVAGSNSGRQLGAGHDEDVRSWQEALCRIEGSSEVTSFPPAGFTIVNLSSGANHTLALLQGTHENGLSPNEIWVAGTGSQGQLGPTHTSSESKSLGAFTRLDLEKLLEQCADLPRSDSEVLLEPKQVVCGWNCSYIVLAAKRAGHSESSNQDVLLALGLHRDNTFGELGCLVGSSSDAADSCVHRVSFSGAVIQAGLDANARVEILDVAAGLRHAVAALSVPANANGKGRILLVGWGSARQGQVGLIPEPPSKSSSSSKRPGPAAAVVWQPQLMSISEVGDLGSCECKVRAGRDHTMELSQEKGQGSWLGCSGSNKQGQLLNTSKLRDNAIELDQVVDVTCNWNSTLALVQRDDGNPAIVGTGSNSRGQLGCGSTVSSRDGKSLVSADLTEILQQSSSTSAVADATGRKTISDASQANAITLKKLVSGSEHSLLLTTGRAQQVWGWGWNEHGNLAQGPHDEADRHRPTLLLDGTRSGTAKHANTYTPLDIWAGFGTSFILAERHRSSHAS